MPQKKAKKPTKPAKLDKSKKASKSAKKPPVKAAKSGGLGAALKKAAKEIGKKAGIGGAKKAVSASKKGAKIEKAPKKVAALPKGKKAPPALSLVKGKKDAGKPLVAKGKKGELVVEVPAPKGVAVIAKDGKKKGKASAEGSVSKKNRCREPGCDHDFSLMGYCRLHYIKNWKRIKRKEGILASGQLNNYVEELVNKYPDKYLDVIRQDLASEKDWNKVVVDLELEGADEEAGSDEEIDAAAEGGVRSSGGTSRAEFDDEGDAF